MSDDVCENCIHFLTKNCNSQSTNPEGWCDKHEEITLQSMGYNPELSYQEELGNIPSDEWWEEHDEYNNQE